MPVKKKIKIKVMICKYADICLQKHPEEKCNHREKHSYIKAECEHYCAYSMFESNLCKVVR